MTTPDEEDQLRELTASIFNMAILNFEKPPKVYGNGPLDAVAAGLIALGEELRATVVAKTEAEKGNVAKGDFIAKMSHELRTPLTTIICSTELLNETQLSDSQQRLVNNMTNTGQLLLRLIDDILQFSATNRGEVSLTNAPMGLKASLNHCREKSLASANSKRLTISLEDDGANELWVLGDEVRLQQVLMNVIGNAIKFTDEGGVNIRLSTQVNATHADISIEIKDSGIGMEPDVVGRVFEQFYSHDSSSRRLHGGAGLGMTISKSIIDAMDGTIEITSSKGIGTLVRISLRLPLAGPGTAGERKPARASITGKRVLLVDDTPLVAEVTCAMLSQLGAVVDILNSGEEALSNKTLQEYDVILMDCQMPNLDGLQTAARLLEENPDADLRIIAFSAHNTEEFVAECLNAGMVHHIGKPFSAAVLIDAIQTFSR